MRHVGLSLFLLLVVCLTTTAIADIAEVISYQGRLLDSGGSPVSDGTHDVVFELFDVASGGTAKWSSGARSMLTTDGFFNYNLGDTTAIPDDLFQQYSELYLQITIVGDPPLTPRTRVASSGYAYHALRADSVDNAPGVTQLIKTANVDLMNGFYVLIASDTITAPSDGYVVCHATTSVAGAHTNGLLMAAIFGITDSVAAPVPTDQENYFVLDAGFPTSLYEIPVHIHKVFAVQAGMHEFNLVASDFSDPGQGVIMTVRNTKFTMTFYDRSYGDVMVSSPASPPSTESNVIAPIDETTRARLREQIER